MTVVAVNELWQGRDGDSDLSVNTYTRVWRVRTDNKLDTAAVVLAAAGLPSRGEPFPANVNAFCRSLRASNESFSPKVWTVTALYSDSTEISEDPTDDPVDIFWDTEQFQRLATKDKNGSAIVNSAGDPYEDLMRDDSRRTVRILFNAYFVPQWVLEFTDAINSANLLIDNVPVGKRCAKMQRLPIGKVQYRNGIAYRQIDLLIHCRKETWRDFEADRGYRRIDPDDATKRIVLVNDDKTELSEPAFMDGSGDKLENPSATTVIYNPIDHYPEYDFTIFPGVVSYAAGPTVTSVTAATGPKAGGTAVTIAGTNFKNTLDGTGLTIQPTVLFRGNNATSVTMVSDTSITCTTPPGPVGPVDVMVQNPDTTNGEKANAFTYTA